MADWAALSELYRANKVRSIAVSNFGDRELGCLFGSPSASDAFNARFLAAFALGSCRRILFARMTTRPTQGFVCSQYSSLGSDVSSWPGSWSSAPSLISS